MVRRLTWIPGVPVEELPTRLGLGGTVGYPEASLRKPLTSWKMEVDDAPILRYIYRAFQPRRHLEFGTWEGTGTLYCLLECDATVWTVNLLRGERTESGDCAYYQRKATVAGQGSTHAQRPSLRLRTKDLVRRRIGITPQETSSATQYASAGFLEEFPEGVAADSGQVETSIPSDAIGAVGRFYLQAGLGHRVCQIYGDSREWDVRNYPEGFFDSAFIDGGHQEDVVVNDTAKALQLVHPGGIIIWHDFCDSEDVLGSCGSTQGVIRAIDSSRPLLQKKLDDLFWVEPSWVLIGKVASPSGDPLGSRIGSD